MQLIPSSAGNKAEHYRELLLQRDQLEKEAFETGLAYTREFGDEVCALFQMKIDCIALKKKISYCQAAANRGEPVDPQAMEARIAAEMAAYNAQLAELLERRDLSRSGRPITPYESQQIKTVYRRIAKLLHPDLSPLTEQIPELADLFQRAMTAYHCNDLRELENCEELIHAVLESHDVDTDPPVIADLPARIQELEKDIDRITGTEPYLYRELLADAEKVLQCHTELENELMQYRQYKQTLEAHLASITPKGASTWQIN